MGFSAAVFFEILDATKPPILMYHFGFTWFF